MLSATLAMGSHDPLDRGVVRVEPSVTQIDRIRLRASPVLGRKIHAHVTVTRFNEPRSDLSGPAIRPRSPRSCSVMAAAAKGPVTVVTPDARFIYSLYEAWEQT